MVVVRFTEQVLERRANLVKLALHARQNVAPVDANERLQHYHLINITVICFCA